MFTYLQTCKQIMIDDPQFDIDDLPWIAHALGRIRRFNGAAEWSVLDHSICVAQYAEQLCPGSYSLGLLHDAHEAITGDIIGPLQRCLSKSARDEIKEIQTLIDLRIRELVGIEYTCESRFEAVADADRAAVAVEWDNYVPINVPSQEAIGTDLDLRYALVSSNYVHGQPWDEPLPLHYRWAEAAIRQPWDDLLPIHYRWAEAAMGGERV